MSEKCSLHVFTIIFFPSVDCLLKLENGRVSLGVITAEEAFLAAPLTSNIVVIGEKHTGIHLYILHFQTMTSNYCKIYAQSPMILLRKPW